MALALARGDRASFLMAGALSYRCELAFVIYPENKSNFCTKGYGLSLNAGRWLRTVCRVINANARFLALACARVCKGLNLQVNFRFSVLVVGRYGADQPEDLRVTPLPLQYEEIVNPAAVNALTKASCDSLVMVKSVAS